LEMKCTQYGICDEVAFKMQGSYRKASGCL
jgi:hypothetical protein